MSKPWSLQVDDYPAGYIEVSQHNSYEEAEQEAMRLFDGGREDDFRIVEVETGSTWNLPAYSLHKEVCPVCGKEIRHEDFRQTRDCHGFPYRWVCLDCFFDIMDGPDGHDGEYYTEADENLDEDY